MSGQSGSSRPREISRLCYAFAQKEDPSKTIVTLHVTYPPDAMTPPHTHKNCSASAYIMSGSIRMATNNGPPTIYFAGEGNYESPDDHNTLCENPSKVEPTIFIATFYIDTAIWEKEGLDALFKLD